MSSAELSELSVVEIVRALSSGATNPYQCRLDDDALYAVKGRAALTWGLLAELVAAKLGTALRLPIPEFCVCRIPRALLRSSDHSGALRFLGDGLLFGSAWREPTEGVSPPSLFSFPPRMLATIYAFDHWIKNGDRTLTEHGGNANLFVNLSDRGLVVVDHNLAFMPSYQPTELELHACRRAWGAVRSDMVFKADLQGLMQYLAQNFDQIARVLPDEWTDLEPDFIGFARGTLARVQSKIFWDELQ